MLRLIEPTHGQILFQGEDLMKLTPAQKRNEREHLQINFQDPYASLNPKMTVEEIVSEPLRIQKKGTQAEIAARTKELLRLVGMQESATER